MAHLHRFFIEPGENRGQAEILLPPEETHHALHVARVQRGEAVALFDGLGHVWQGRVTRIGKRDVAVALDEEQFAPRPSRTITVAQAWLLREKSIEFMVLHGTELGVGRFCFFHSAHSERPGKINPKWRRLAVEACKQCGRLWLPEFHVAENLDEVLDSASGAVLIATKDRPPSPLAAAIGEQDVTLVVGPEGDFTDAELDAALQRGARAVSLGETTFRSEMATVVLAAIAGFVCGQLGPTT